MNPEIRPVTIDELEELRSIAESTFRDTYERLNEPEEFEDYVNSKLSRQEISNQIRDPNSHFYLVWLNNQIVGYFHLLERESQTDLKEWDSFEISRFYVLPGNKGKGIGRFMMDAVKELATEHSKKSIWLGVWEHNPSAIAFYQKMGFETFGTHVFSIGSDDQTDYLMRFGL